MYLCKRSNWKKFLVPFHFLTDINITKNLNYKSRFNGIYRDNLPKIENSAYVINLNEKESKRTHRVQLFIDKFIAMHFDSLGMEYTPQEVLNKTKEKSIIRNIFQCIQDDDSIMCGFYWIAFIKYLLARKIGYTNLFSPNDHEKKSNRKYKFFKDKYDKPWC